MKKIALALFFALLAVPQVFAESIYSKDARVAYAADPNSLTMGNTIFLRGNLGLDIELFDFYFNKEGYETSYHGELTGVGPIGELDIGVNFKRLFALYGNFTFKFFDGDYCVDSDYCRDSDSFGLLFGAGALLYPFRDIDGLKHLNFGVNTGFGMTFVSENDSTETIWDIIGISLEDKEEPPTIVQNLFFYLTLEAGFMWDLARRFTASVNGFFTLHLIDGVDVNHYEECRNFSNFAFGIKFSVMRR